MAREHLTAKHTITDKGKPNKQLIYNGATVCAVFIFMMFLNMQCGFFSDDLHFRFVWRDFMPLADDKPVESLWDILLSMKNYYQFSGGRVFPHFLAFVFSAMDKTVFNIANSAVFCAGGLLIYNCAVAQCEGLKRNAFVLMFVYCSMFFGLTDFGDCCLWISGAVNYLWMSVLALFTIQLFQKHAQTKSLPVRIALYLCVLLCACSNETTGGMLLIIILCEAMFRVKRVNLNIAVCGALSVMGMLSVVLAPGNSHRAENIEHTEMFSLSKILPLLGKYARELLKGKPVILLLAAGAVVGLILLKEKPANFLLQLETGIAGAAGIAALTLTGFFSKRPMILGVYLLIAQLWQTIPYIAAQLAPRNFRGCLRMKMPSLLRHFDAAAAVVLVIALGLCAWDFSLAMKETNHFIAEKFNYSDVGSITDFPDTEEYTSYDAYLVRTKSFSVIKKHYEDVLFFPLQAYQTATKEYSYNWYRQLEKFGIFREDMLIGD